MLLTLTGASQAELSAFSHEHLNIKIGQAIFEKLWVFAPSSTKSSDGLGPFYNARSCAQCHDISRPDANNLPPSLVIMLSIEPYAAELSKQNQDALKHIGFIPDPVYGKQIQSFAYPGAKAEAQVTLTEQRLNYLFPDGQEVSLRKPSYQLSALGYGELHADVRFSARVAPRMLGLSLLDALPDTALFALEDPDDKDGDGISGRVNRVWDPLTQSIRAGRFGWKAGKANLEHQNLAALSSDIGVSSWLFPLPEGDCSARQAACTELAQQTETMLAAYPQAENTRPEPMLEASRKMTDLLQAFTRDMGTHVFKTQTTLQQKKSNSPALAEGKQLFLRSGCAACHSSKFSGIIQDSEKSAAQVQISPFSDLLLHDMGEALADNRQEFTASGREWRTAPLWGMADYLSRAASPRFLHDGRAASIMEAILWHGGEADASVQAFAELNKQQRQTLIHFVESL